MKDGMTRQERFLQSKVTLDKCISRVSRLAAEAYEEALACCKVGDLDSREQFTAISAHLDGALKEMKLARAEAGRVQGGSDPITRSGGT